MFGLLKKPAAAQGRVGVVAMPDQVAIAVLQRDGTAQPVLERCEVLPLAGGKGADEVAAVLRAAGLPRLPVSAVLLSGEYQLSLVEAPDVPPAELRAAMRWRLRDAIDFPVEEAVIDVFDVPSQSRGGHGRVMYAVAARRTNVDRITASLAGVAALDAIDVPELCLRNLATLLPAAPSGIAVLHLGAAAATAIIVRGSTLFSARQMDFRGTLRFATDTGSGDGPIDAASIVLELQRSLDYYERQFDQPPITHLAIAPAGALAESLAADLGREMSCEVVVLDLNKLFACRTPVAPEVQRSCLLAVGAALRAERRSL